MSLPAITSRASGAPNAANARSSASAPLRGVSLASSSTSGASPRPVAARKRAPSGAGSNSRSSIGLAGRVMRLVGTPSAASCTPFGFADRQHPRRAFEIPASGRRVEDLLGEKPALDERRGAVRRHHVGNARLGQDPGRRRHREVAARVQVRDVDTADRRPQGAAEAVRCEELPVIRERFERLRRTRTSRGPGPACGVWGARARASWSQASVVQTVTWWPAPGQPASRASSRRAGCRRRPTRARSTGRRAGCGAGTWTNWCRIVSGFPGDDPHAPATTMRIGRGQSHLGGSSGRWSAPIS